MTKLQLALQDITASKRMAIMTHVVVGYPTLSDTKKLIKLMAKKGVDFIELQIPFSDPLADGPIIMKACEEALANGMKVKDAFDLAKELSNEINTPLLFMGYYNTVYQYGVQKFCVDAKKAGIEALIIPDIPLEEQEDRFDYYCQKTGLARIRVVSPASTDERLKKNAAVNNEFIYCTARQGTTGIRGDIDPQTSIFLKRVRKYFTCPISVGFGISEKEHIKKLQGQADIAVVGSALVKIAKDPKKVETFLDELVI